MGDLGCTDQQCPVRIGDACRLCASGASCPQDCPLVALVMSDPELRARLNQLRLEAGSA